MGQTKNSETKIGAQSRQLKVLLSAYACSPGRGSEPGNGWNMVQQVSRFHEAWVIVNEEHRKPIEEEIQKNPIPSIHWIFVDLPHWLTFWKKEERGRRIHYYMWQIVAYFKGKKFHKQVHFDLIHHITYASYWTPSFLAQLPVPFIWGPVGGAESTPDSFYPTLSASGRRYEIIRNTVRWLSQTVDPYVRLTARRSRIVLSTSEETATKMRQLGARDVRMLPDAGLPPPEIEVFGSLDIRREVKPFRVLSMGRLMGWKGFHLGVMAFAEFQKQVPESEYWVIGEGKELEHLITLAHKLGVGDKVQFMGKIPRQQAMQRLAECDVLVHPSLHETGGWVCLEAMAAGRPVICLKLGGPAVNVTDEAGFRVPAHTPEQAVADLARAMQRLAEDPELRIQMGQAGRRRIHEHFNWERRGEQIDELYGEVLRVQK